jgi:hypothetical protein
MVTFDTRRVTATRRLLRLPGMLAPYPTRMPGIFHALIGSAAPVVPEAAGHFRLPLIFKLDLDGEERQPPVRFLVSPAAGGFCMRRTTGLISRLESWPADKSCGYPTPAHQGRIRGVGCDSFSFFHTRRIMPSPGFLTPFGPLHAGIEVHQHAEGGAKPPVGCSMASSWPGAFSLGFPE